MIEQSEIAAMLQIARSSVAVHISNLQRKGYILGKGYLPTTEVEVPEQYFNIKFNK